MINKMTHKRLSLTLLIVLCLILSMGSVSAQSGTTGNTICSGSVDAMNYFASQLSGRETKFYHAFEKMAKDEFLTGKDLVLTDGSTSDNWHFSQSEAQIANDTLLQDMAAARDAFQYDHPEVFYIDWNDITLRINKSGSGIVMHLGSGRTKDYYLDGFDKGEADLKTKIDAYNKKLEEVINSVKHDQEVTNAEEKNKQRLMVKVAHNYLTTHMVYRYEHEVYNQDLKDSNWPAAGITGYSNARTAYDALMYGEGVCEAYTRAFKAIMDKLQIPTICVHGAFMTTDGKSEEHIWNYVELKDSDTNSSQCYIVDVTMDDPIRKAVNGVGGEQPRVKPTEKRFGYGDDTLIKSGVENEYLLLVGEVATFSTHIPSGNLSSAQKEFRYPSINADGIGDSQDFSGGNFRVKLIKEVQTDSEYGEIDAGTVLVSYNKKNYTENKKEGDYMLCRFRQVDDSDGKEEVYYSDWIYLDMTPYDSQNAHGFEPDYNYPDMGHVVRLPFPQVDWVQFAVTSVPSKYDLSGGQFSEDMFYYTGDPSLITIKSPEVTNQWGDYKAPPYPVQASPAGTGKLNCTHTYDISLTFDDLLCKPNTKTPIKEGDISTDDLELTVKNSQGFDTSETTKPLVGLSNLHVDTVQINDPTSDFYHPDGSSVKTASLKNVTRVTFTIDPSKSYTDESALYTFKVKGVVGHDSDKEPMGVSYYFGYPQKKCAYYSNLEKDWDVFGQPQLLDAEEAIKSLVDGDSEFTGEGVDLSKISHRLQLVVTQPNEQSSETKDLKENLEKSQDFKDGTNESIAAAEFYNIYLSLCKKMVIGDGHKVRVCVGFPINPLTNKRYEYSDFLGGTAFKAYHYKTDPNTGKLTGEVEEIDCEVTELGLIITCDSFSPFAITAMNLTEQGKVQHSQLVKEIQKQTKVLFSTTNGGTIIDSEGKNISNGELVLNGLSDNKSVTVKAEKIDGVQYVIDDITIDGQSIAIDHEDPYTETLNIYASSAEELGKTKRVHVSFVPESIQNNETSSGENHQDTNNTPPITVDYFDVTLHTGQTLTIAPHVIDDPDAVETYQWYKDDKKIAGATEKDFIKDNVTEKDSGLYRIRVTSKVSGAADVVAEGPPVTVTVLKGDTPGEYTIKTNVEPKDSGVVSGEGLYIEKTTAVLEAEANPGYTFSHWLRDGKKVGLKPLYKVNVTKDLDITAVFVKANSEPDTQPSPGPSPNPEQKPEQQPEQKPDSESTPETNVDIYRVYNGTTGEHLYTPFDQEVQSLTTEHGWTDEGKGWTAPSAGTAVYRLFNPTISDHLYTCDENEVNILTRERGWVADNSGQPMFYAQNSGTPVYRLYNEGNQRHLLTTDSNEYNVLGDNGWKQEGVAFYSK